MKISTSLCSLYSKYDIVYQGGLIESYLLWVDLAALILLGLVSSGSKARDYDYRLQSLIQ